MQCQYRLDPNGHGADNRAMNPIESTLPPVGRDAIRAAYRRIAGRIRHTPIVEANLNGHPLSFKLECLQRSGSFKARGAFNRLLAALDDPGQADALSHAGVVAASGGNHGIAVALAAAELGLAAQIFVPAATPAAKQARLRSLGARLHPVGERYAEAFAASQEHARATGALTVHAYDQPEVLAGQGTVALEWARQRPDLDTVLVAVGGGGLIGGIAAWFESRTRVIAVEPERCPTLNAALAAGNIVEVSPGGLAADSLGASRVGALMFPIARRHVAGSVLVSDEAIRRAQAWLWNELRVAAEPGGAAAFAAILDGAWQAAPGERVGVLVCGANLQPGSLD
jgi:threonine dehydratase